MLNELKQTNKNLKKQLGNLLEESGKLLDETHHKLKVSSKMESTLASRAVSSTRRDFQYDPALSHCPFREQQGMLSDRAKVIRGEASKRIEALLVDWREYKAKADEELRRKCRSQQMMREALSRKEREVEHLNSEIASLRNVANDQKRKMEQLRHELEVEANCKNRCVEMERELSKMNRYIHEVEGKLHERENILGNSEAERQSLADMNEQLRELNDKLKAKLECYERDIEETQKEMGVLEEIIQTLSNRKSVMMLMNNSPTSLHHSPMDQHYTSSPRGAASNRNASLPPQYRNTDESSIHASLLQSSHSKNDAMGKSFHSRAPHIDMEDASRQLYDRQSAMTALKSLQKEHAEKCNSLADSIQTLKLENKAKEEKINRLQRRAAQ